MRKYRNGFSLRNGIVALLLVIMMAAVSPSFVEKYIDKNTGMILDDSIASSVFSDLKREYIYSCAYSNAYAAGLNQSYLLEPIVIDTIGNGIVISSLNDGIYFDYNGDGFAEKMAWAKNGNGVLYADYNLNGIADNGSELLTADSLKTFDTNNDGIINSKDKNFSILKLMKIDGSSISLSDAKISEIGIEVSDSDETDENGNHKFGEGWFKKQNGETGKYEEYFFVADLSDSQELENLKETKSVSKLPDIKSRGTVHSLHQAMLRDVELERLVSEFTKELNDEKRVKLAENILLKWSKSENIDKASRGENVNGQHLAVVEAFMGVKFGSQSDSTQELKITNNINPNVPAGELLETIYVKLLNYTYAELMSQTHLCSLVKLIKKQDKHYDLSRIVKNLEKEIKQNETVGKSRVLQFAKVVKGLGLDKNSNFFNPKDENCFYLKFASNDRELKWQIDTIAKVPMKNSQIIDGELMGTAGDDSYRIEEGAKTDLLIHTFMGEDVLYGNSQNDSFAACDDNDILDGGSGDDKLIGNAGDDLIFGGDGDDFIVGAEGNDIIFGGDGDDRIYPDHTDESDIAFDKLYDNRINAVYSFNENDEYYQKIYKMFVPKGEYNDIVNAGKGNDVIFAIVGDDTYIFNLGDGQDIIFEKQGQDTLYFGKGIKWTDLLFVQSNNDMIIKIKNTNDQITVKDWFVAVKSNSKVNLNNQIEVFEFADGTKHTIKEIQVVK